MKGFVLLAVGLAILAATFDIIKHAPVQLPAILILWVPLLLIAAFFATPQTYTPHIVFFSVYFCSVVVLTLVPMPSVATTAIVLAAAGTIALYGTLVMFTQLIRERPKRPHTPV